MMDGWMVSLVLYLNSAAVEVALETSDLGNLQWNMYLHISLIKHININAHHWNEPEMTERRSSALLQQLCVFQMCWIQLALTA